MNSIFKPANCRTLGIIFFLSTVLFSCFVFIFLSVEKKRSEKSINSSFQYQIYQRNVDEGDESFGIITLFDESRLGNLEYLFEENESSEVLISKFGTTEYECSGSCYCEPLDIYSERKGIIPSSSTTFVRGGLTVLVASISAVLASEYAKKDLDRKCEDLHSSSSIDCSGRVLSEVDECKLILKEEDIDKKIEELEELKKKPFFKKNKDEKKYLCSGNCLTSTFLKDEWRKDVETFKVMSPKLVIDDFYTKLVQTAEDFECEKYKYEVVLDYEAKREHFWKEMTESYNVRQRNERNVDQTPEKYFIFFDLREYCSTVSTIDFFSIMESSTVEYLLEEDRWKYIIVDQNPQDLSQPEIIKLLEKVEYGKTSLCMSDSDNFDIERIHGASLDLRDFMDGFVDTPDVGGENPSVKCRLIK